MIVKTKKGQRIVKKLTKEAAAAALAAGAVVGGTVPLAVFSSELPIAPVRIINPTGAQRVSDDAKAELAAYIDSYADKIAEVANRETRNAGRKTVKAEDIVISLAR